MKRRAEEIDKSIERYLRQLDAMDQGSAAITEMQTPGLKEKTASLIEEVQQLQSIEIHRTESPDQQVSLTDPDARSITARGTGIVDYNVQTAVDSQHHFILAHEVTNVSSDRRQLYRMGQQARDASAVSNLHVVADRGYFMAEEILACHKIGIMTHLPKTKTSPSQAKPSQAKLKVCFPEKRSATCLNVMNIAVQRENI
ncbi:transposase [Halomonas sp. ISL-60]|uniref:transposase n=1 Tax=Halomonas sp. ISL-56 TaxID=2819149 RepID=UPI001BEB85D7|nr:transposase [Halomonas sp. ISL-56]MBT2772752.1 transposase [Halomonas sp. ISL-60]MBT2800547.1 transposase [Halomonas sp. ISL-56]